MVQAMRHHTREASRYFAVSLLALGADILMFSLLLRVLLLPWAIAATLGFAVGVTIAYFLSTRWVFANRVLAQTPRMEFFTFLSIGVFGLGVTQFALWIGIELLHAQPELSKLVAAGFTFIFNYALRKLLLFRRHATPITVS